MTNNQLNNTKCTKVCFVDEKFALRYIDKLNKTSYRDIKPVRAYLCEKCLCWHLTSIESRENREAVYLGRQINNLKAKILHLQNENNYLKKKLEKYEKNNA